MSHLIKQKWKDFVTFLFHRQNFNKDVSENNGSLLSGIMYAEGWRKASVKNQIVGRYVNQSKLNNQMKKDRFNQGDEETGFIEMENFLSEIFQDVAGVSINLGPIAIPLIPNKDPYEFLSNKNKTGLSKEGNSNISLVDERRLKEVDKGKREKTEEEEKYNHGDNNDNERIYKQGSTKLLVEGNQSGRSKDVEDEEEERRELDGYELGKPTEEEHEECVGVQLPLMTTARSLEFGGDWSYLRLSTTWLEFSYATHKGYGAMAKIKTRLISDLEPFEPYWSSIKVIDQSSKRLETRWVDQLLMQEATDNFLQDLSPLLNLLRLEKLTIVGLRIESSSKTIVFRLPIRTQTRASEDWKFNCKNAMGAESILEAHGGHGSVRTPHLEDGGDGGAAEDRARLCESFDGLWKPGGQG
ncbi:hypothetical protein PPACK8108_LOCUS10093 [Phakopsora pachyrhizi]|uniref:Tet-like 2OG-Fe(II) oxygenase domain-containing protein n=1 Tax=Phakopsora pachyrhizi TaxID=170000 RepID=A0AAV0B2P9_PHAPC|nr:hypothetical protein PPACK8108_LOCUS10093 [Phakopsora pachyrhizi]